MNTESAQAELLTDVESDVADQVDGQIRRNPLNNQFCVNSPESANWLVRQILERRAYQARVAQWAETERQQAEREEQRLLYLYGNQLRLWATTELGRQRGRSKSIHLPAGRVGYRHVSAKIVIDDAAAVLDWAKVYCPEAVETTEKVVKSSLDKHLVATGELPDKGAHMEPAMERFYIA